MALKSKVEKKEIPGQKVDINEVMVLNFISQDPPIQEGIKCLADELFVDVEKKLYEKYDKLKERENCFLSNSILISRFKTIKENKIPDKAKILIYEK